MGLHLQMRPRPQFGKHRGNGIVAIFIKKRGQPCMTQFQRADLRIQVAIDRQWQA